MVVKVNKILKKILLKQEIKTTKKQNMAKQLIMNRIKKQMIIIIFKQIKMIKNMIKTIKLKKLKKIS